MRRTVVCVLRGMVAIAVAHLSWGVLLIGLGAGGLRFASDTRDPTIAAIAAQQWRDLIGPLYPTALLFGGALGYAASRRMLLLPPAVLGALAAPTAFLATAAAALLIPRAGGGYAAEQGMAAILVVLAPLVGLSAAPFWALATAWLASHTPVAGDQ